jgi:hypothetical protein
VGNTPLHIGVLFPAYAGMKIESPVITVWRLLTPGLRQQTPRAVNVELLQSYRVNGDGVLAVYFTSRNVTMTRNGL